MVEVTVQVLLQVWGAGAATPAPQIIHPSENDRFMQAGPSVQPLRLEISSSAFAPAFNGF